MSDSYDQEVEVINNDEDSEDDYYNKLQAHADTLSNYDSDEDVVTNLQSIETTVFENDKDYYEYVNNTNTLSDVGILPENDIIWQELLRQTEKDIPIKINSSMNANGTSLSLLHLLNLEPSSDCPGDSGDDGTVTLLLLEQWLFSHLPLSSRLYVMLRNQKVAFSSKTKETADILSSTVSSLPSSSSAATSASSSKSFTYLYVDHLQHPSFIMIVNKNAEQKGTLYVSAFSCISYANPDDEVVETACDILSTLLMKSRNASSGSKSNKKTGSTDNISTIILKYNQPQNTNLSLATKSHLSNNNATSPNSTSPTSTTLTHYIESSKPSIEFDAVNDTLLNTLTTCLLNTNMSTNMKSHRSHTHINSTTISQPLIETWRVQAGLFVLQSPLSIINNNTNSNNVGGSGSSGDRNEVGLPDGYEFSELNADHHAELINELWKYHSELSIHMVRRMIQHYPCVGIQYTADLSSNTSNIVEVSMPISTASAENMSLRSPSLSSSLAHQNQQSSSSQSSSQLVCWCLTYADGAIGMLHTLENHRHKGLARAIVQKIITRYLQYNYGCLPFCYIESSNEASSHLFSSLGFTRADDQSWSNIE